MREVTPYEALFFIFDQYNESIGIRDQDFRLEIDQNTFRGFLFNDGRAVVVRNDLNFYITDASELLSLGARLR